MKYLIGKRGTGRTSKLIEWVKEKPETRCLVVMSDKEEYRIKKEYNNAFHVLNIHAFRGRSTQWVKFREIAFDNADYMMMNLFDIPISIMSLTANMNEDVIAL